MTAPFSMPPSCPREAEVVTAVRTRGIVADADLASHVERCETCREVFVVAQAMRDLSAADAAAAHVPTAGLVWWKSELRARREAARLAARPITAVQGIALTCAAAALVGIAGWWMGLAGTWLASLRNAVLALTPNAAATSLWVGGGACLLVLLLPVAVYLATSDR